jgi:DNA-binding LacI/PurR family transcriptional regulator
VIGRGAAPEASREQLLSLCGQRPAGIVWMSVTWFGSEFTPILEQYRASGGSLVCLDWQPGTTPGIKDAFPVGASGVTFDRFHNSFTVTEHLLDLGHRFLGVFLGPGSEDTHTKLTRGRGVLRACECEGSGDDPITLRWFDSAFHPGGPAGADIAEQFLAIAPSERPTGMVLLNDRTAMAFIARVQAAGVRVPEDVSVVGHDDDELSSFFPVPLTTITHPHQALAEAAADMMDRIIGEQREKKEDESGTMVEVRGELRVRASTTAPPASATRARR